MENRKNHTDFLLVCPLPAGTYSYKDFPMTTDLLPQLLFDTRFKLTFTLKVQTPNSLRMKEACSTITIGKFVRKKM